MSSYGITFQLNYFIFFNGRFLYKNWPEIFQLEEFISIDRVAGCFEFFFSDLKIEFREMMNRNFRVVIFKFIH